MRDCGRAAVRRPTGRVVAGCMACALAAAATGGCSRAPAPPSGRVAAVASMPAAVRSSLLDGAIAVLSRLDDYDENAAFTQVFDRINQWSHAEVAPPGAEPWQPDPLFQALPERYRTLAEARGLDATAFEATADVAFLRDQRWLADIARRARGDAIDDVAVAERLFTWTVQSLAVVADPPGVPTETNAGSRWFLPGEILLAGRASAAQRSWIFLELLRQAGLEGVMLATGDDPASARPWVPAVVSGGDAYLFEPTYGMAIPGPGGVGVATVRQAAADPSILASLSLPDRAYPVRPDDLKKLSVLVAADPVSLSQRMRRLEARLSGASRLSLSIDASAVARRAGDAVADAGVGRGLWAFPWETLGRRGLPATRAALASELAVMTITMEQVPGVGSLRRGRVLRPLYAARVREFRGDLDGIDGAKAAYLAARPTTAAVQAATMGLPPPQAEATRRMYERMKEDATYWLGALTLAEGDAEAAVDYLDRILLTTAADSRWTDAARVTLARALTSLGRSDDAIRMLQSDASPQRFGSRILAARLTAAAR